MMKFSHPSILFMVCPCLASKVADLNKNPKLPYGDSEFDFVTNVVSVDYLVKPQEAGKCLGFIGYGCSEVCSERLGKLYRYFCNTCYNWK